MSIHDRPYMRDEQGGGIGGGPMRGLTFGLPKPGRAVKWLLILNVVAFVAQLLFQMAGIELSDFFGATSGAWWQIHRYVTFQFLHSPENLFHLALNMLGLYMLGAPLEQRWGSRRFVRFYLICGAVAGAAYVIVAEGLKLPGDYPLIGASGGVYGILLACAVLFPQFKLIFFLFPVPIRLAAIIIFAGMTLTVLSGLSSGNALYNPLFWSHVAHLGGAVTAAVWIWVVPRLRAAERNRVAHVKRGAWERKMRLRDQDEAEVNRILDKIRTEGLASLNRREKKILQDATNRQKDEERDLHRL